MPDARYLPVLRLRAHDLHLGLEGCGLDGDTVDENVTLLEGVNTDKALDGRALARTVGAEEAVDLACLEGDGKVLHRVDGGVGIAFCQVLDL